MNETGFRARELRKHPSKVEARVWRWLRDRRFGDMKFRRQHPIGPYIADFYCHELQLVIELDGPEHYEQDHYEYDERRTNFLRHRGIFVLRIANDTVLKEPDAAGDAIRAAVDQLARTADPGRVSCS